MATRGALGFKGLKTAGNPLTHPAGSLGLAQNCVIPSKDILEPRRGQPVYNFAFGTTSSTALALYEWGVLPVLHYGTTLAGTTLAVKTGGAWVDCGGLVAPDPNVQRAKFAQMSSNLYATSSSGLMVLDSTSHSTALAGVSSPLPITTASLSGNPNASGTWMATNTAVGYRACFVKKDANNNVKLSRPTGRVVVVNPADAIAVVGAITRSAGSTVTAVVTAHSFKAGDIFALTPGEADFAAGNYTIGAVGSSFIQWTNAGANVSNGVQQTLSSGTKNVAVQVNTGSPASLIVIAAGDFAQLYRTDASAGATIDPGDEEFLCYERQLTATDITNTYIAITDTTPDSFLGAALYANANTGEGINQANEKPPQCKDVAVFDGRLWGADTVDRQRLTLRLLGVGSPNGLQNSDIICVGGCAISVTAISSYLPSQNIQQTCSLYAADFSQTAPALGESRLCFPLFDGDSPTGQLLFEDINPAGSTFYAATSRASAFQDPLPTVARVAASGLVRTSGSTVTATTTTAHGFAQGDAIGLAVVGSAAAANFAVGLKTVASVSGSTVFTYTESGTNADSGSVTYYVYATKVGSDSGNRQLRYSKQGQPEAWPLVNYPGGLPDGATVLRIAAMNGSLYVFLKNNDIYTVSGSYPYNVQKFDGTATLIAADSLVEHSGRLHCLTTQGVVAISDTGVQALSSDIETDLRVRVAGLSAAQLARTFGVSYESDRQYQLWMADASQSNSLSTSGAWVYHSDSGLWTTWGGTTSGTRCNRTCGLVTRADNLLKLGDGDTGSTSKPQNKLRQEVKNYSNQDAYDYAMAMTATGDDSLHTLTPADAADLTYIQPGDVLLFAGSYVVVYSVGASSLTYTGTLGNPSAQAVVCYLQVPAAYEWLIDAGGAAGVEKNWRDIQTHFAFVWAPTVTATFLNERSVGSTSTVTITPPDWAGANPFNNANVLRTLRAAVPGGYQRGAMLRLRLTFNGLSHFRALGWSQTQEGISERTGS